MSDKRSIMACDVQNHIFECCKIIDHLELTVQHAITEIGSVNQFLQTVQKGFTFSLATSSALKDHEKFFTKGINYNSSSRRSLEHSFFQEVPYTGFTLLQRVKDFAFHVDVLENFIDLTYELCETLKFQKVQKKMVLNIESQMPKSHSHSNARNVKFDTSYQLRTHQFHDLDEKHSKEFALFLHEKELATGHKNENLSNQVISFMTPYSIPQTVSFAEKNWNQVTNLFSSVLLQNSNLHFLPSFVPSTISRVGEIYSRYQFPDLLLNLFETVHNEKRYLTFSLSNCDLVEANSGSDSSLITLSDNKSCREESSIRQLSIAMDENLLINVFFFLIMKNKYLEAKNSTLTESVNTLLDVKCELEQNVKDMEKKMSDSCHKQHIEILLKENEFRKRANYIFLKERNEFHQLMASITEERNLLLLELKDVKNCSHNMEVEFDLIQDEYIRYKSTKEEEISDLLKRYNLETAKYECILKRFSNEVSEIEDMKKKIKEQEDSLCFFENFIREIKCERDLEIKQQWEELKEIQYALVTRDEECMALNDDLKKSVGDRDEEHQRNNILLSEIFDLKEIMKSMEDELNLYRSDCREIRKKLIKAIKDKDLLWKRTDHLTHLREAQVAGRWMNDHEATSCLGCNMKFSFTLRKHHCRLCGKIFCRVCANNWLSTTASRSQIRVCGSCYVEHLQLKEAVKDGSSVNSITESDDEGGGNSFFNNADTGMFSMNSDASYSAGFGSIDLFGSLNNLSFASPDERASRYDKKRKHHREMDRNNFDIITDEEIEKSLSHSSPYNASLDEKMYQETNLDSCVSLTLTRTTTEIQSTADVGISGTVWINAGMCCGLPILCDIAPCEIRWKFLCCAKTLTFTIVFKNSEDAKEYPISNSQLKREDNIILPNTGLYVILFDNSFSRVKARKVQYTLWSTEQI